MDRVARFFLAQHTKTKKNLPNDHKISQIANTYTKWTENLPNGHKIYQHLLLQDPPKLTQIVFENKASGNTANETLKSYNFEGGNRKTFRRK
jgi:hypothetical protein